MRILGTGTAIVTRDAGGSAPAEAGGWLGVPSRRSRRGLFVGPYRPATTSPGSSQFYATPDRFLTNDELWEVYRRTPDVRAAVDSVVRRVATFDWYIEPAVDPSSDDYEEAATVAETARRFLSAPSKDGTTWQEVFTALLTDLLVYDAAALEIVRDANGDLAELNPLRGSSVTPRINEHGRLLYYEQEAFGAGSVGFRIGEQVDANDPAFSGVRFDPDALLYLRLFPTTSSPVGNPLIESLVTEVISMLRSSEHSMLALDADEIPPGILVLAGLAGQAAREATADLQRLRGQDQKIRVLTTPDPSGIGARWVELRHTPKDLSFAEVVDQIRRTIWRVFGVLPVEMGATDGVNRATAEVQVDVSSSYLVTPILELIAAKINTRLLPLVVGDESLVPLVRFRFDREAKTTPEQAKAVAEKHTRYVAAGILTRNEARADLGLLPVAGGDVPTVDTSAGPVPLALLVATEDDSPTEPDPDDGAPPPGDVEPEPDSEDEGIDDPDAGTPDAEDDAPGEVESKGRGAPRSPLARAVGDEDPTNFPKAGDDLKVSLRNSGYATFDPAFAERLRTEHPTVWGRGGNTLGNKQYRRLRPVALRGGVVETETEEEAVRLRESWSARHFKDHRIAGVVAQIKWLTVGSLGESGMKEVVEEEIARLDEDRSAVACCSPERALDFAPSEEERDRMMARARAVPSEWLPGGLFDDVRTVDLSEVGAVVATYIDEVTERWRAARAESVGAVVAALRGGGSEESASKARSRLNKSLERLAVDWSATTSPLYHRAAAIGAAGALRFSGIETDSATSFASRYASVQFGYLSRSDGLLADVRLRMLAAISLIDETGQRGAADLRADVEIPPPEPTGAATVAAKGDRAAAAILLAEAAWDANENRIASYAGRLVEVSNGTFVLGLSEANAAVGGSSARPDSAGGPREATEWYAEWVATLDSRTCEVCSAEGQLPIRRLSSLPTQPGGATPCGGRCRCVLVVWTESEVRSGEAIRIGPFDD